MEPIDNRSLGGCVVAMISGIVSQVSSSTVLVWVSIMVGITTILYNGIKIYKEVKSKKDGESNGTKP